MHRAFFFNAFSKPSSSRCAPWIAPRATNAASSLCIVFRSRVRARRRPSLTSSTLLSPSIALFQPEAQLIPAYACQGGIAPAESGCSGGSCELLRWRAMRFASAQLWPGRVSVCPRRDAKSSTATRVTPCAAAPTKCIPSVAGRIGIKFCCTHFIDAHDVTSIRVLLSPPAHSFREELLIASVECPFSSDRTYTQ